jgi:hypothetical protein
MIVIWKDLEYSSFNHIDIVSHCSGQSHGLKRLVRPKEKQPTLPVLDQARGGLWVI